MAETTFEVVTRDEIRALLERHDDHSLSIFMPTHRVGPETELDRVRLKNLLSQAFEELRGRGLRRPEAAAILSGPSDLLDDLHFWRHQLDGLALFAARNFFRSYRLPFEVQERLVLDNRFHTKPLLPTFSNEGHFYILALSQNSVRLLSATRHEVKPLELENTAMPRSLADVLQYDDFERRDGDLQHRPTARASTGGKHVFHGHGPGGEDQRKDLQRFCQAVGHGLAEVLPKGDAPLVLAAVDYLHPLFRAVGGYRAVVEGGIEGNPDHAGDKELHAKALPLVEPHFASPRRAAADRYGSLAKEGRSSCELAEVLAASGNGRVDALFVRKDGEVWGSYDAGTNTLTMEDGADGATDLLDLAARQTLLHRGEVYLVDENEMPCDELVAAVFRY